MPASEDPLKIAFVSLASLPYHVAGVGGARGGAEAQTLVLARALRGLGHEVAMVVTDFDEAARRARRLTDLPLVNAYDSGDGVPGLRFFTPRWTGLNRALDEAEPDVVFQMCAGAGTGQVAMHCRRRSRGFVFATASDTDVDPRRLRLGRKERWLYEYGLHRADRVVTQHPRQAAELLANYGVRSTPVALGVEIPERVPAPADPPYVLWLGTLRGVKRPDRWLDLAERFPGHRFVMVGGASGGEPEVFETSRRRAAELENVEFRGPVEDVGEVLDGAWVLLNTSDVEGYPTTFLEAWSRGIPVVSLFDPDDQAATHDLGWIASGDADLARCLGACLEDRALRDAKGARGRGHVEREHAPEVVGRRMEAVMREAIEARRGR